MTEQTSPAPRRSTRLIGFFDILGFSTRVQNMSPEEVHALYARLIDHARDRLLGPIDISQHGDTRVTNLAFVQFLFDSLVVVSHPIDLAEPDPHGPNFVTTCLTIMGHSFGLHLPLRGCIGLGELLHDPQRGLFLSKVFPNIVAGEKAQCWSGCFLLEEAAAVLAPSKSSQDPRQSERLVYYPVPTRVGAFDRWCLNWVRFMDAEALTTGLAFLDDVKGPHTRRFVDHVRALSTQCGAISPASY
jgi:hypothetical protein